MDLEKRAPSQGEEQNWSSHQKGDQDDNNNDSDHEDLEDTP